MPRGRPPGSKDKAKWGRAGAALERALYIDRLTDGGAFVADKMFRIAGDDAHPEQMAALKWLAENDLAGKPATNVEIDVTHSEQPAEVYDYDALTLEEAKAWRELALKATRALPEHAPEATPDLSDVTEAEVVE